MEVRPGELLDSVDLEEIKEKLFKELGRQVTDFEIISYALYPKVFMEYMKIDEQYGNISVLDTPTFLYGMRLGEEIEVEIETGKH